MPFLRAQTKRKNTIFVSDQMMKRENATGFVVFRLRQCIRSCMQSFKELRRSQLQIKKSHIRSSASPRGFYHFPRKKNERKNDLLNKFRFIDSSFAAKAHSERNAKRKTVNVSPPRRKKAPRITRNREEGSAKKISIPTCRRSALSFSEVEKR